MKCVSTRFISLTALAVSLAAAPVSGQTSPKLNGNYVFTENGTTPSGQNISTLASLTVGDNGAIAGTELIKTGSGLNMADVQGNFNLSGDNTGTLTLSVASTDAEGNALTANQTYKLLVSGNGDMLAVRADAGYYTTASVVAAAKLNAGTYLFTELASGQQSARATALKFDTAGNANGFAFEDAMGVTNRTDLGGSYQLQPAGFNSLTLSRQFTDDNGETQTVRRTYMFLVGRNDLRMLRTDGSPEGIVVLTR